MGTIATSDNLSFDDYGDLMIATDGQSRPLRINDGIFFVPTEGPVPDWILIKRPDLGSARVGPPEAWWRAPLLQAARYNQSRGECRRPAALPYKPSIAAWTSP